MNTVRIAGGLELVDLALHLLGHQTLVIADVHLGFEESLHQDGALVPRGYFKRLWRRWEGIAARLGISSKCPLERVIINGDLSHQFGPLSAREGTESQELLERLGAISREIVVLEGNHDGNLGFLAEVDERIRVCRSYKLGDLLFLHGDSEPARLPPGVKTIVIGHEHPAVGLRDRITGRVELYKCFLVGSYRDRRLVVQPSFNPLVSGSDLTRERRLSPLLDEAALEEFEVYTVSDEGSVYRFGPLKHLMGPGSRVGG
jgi:putative SbcD/Mre11-related phosphoesterase